MSELTSTNPFFLSRGENLNNDKYSIEEYGPFSLEAYAKTGGKSSCKADVTPHLFNEGDLVRITNPTWETTHQIGSKGAVLKVWWVSWNGYEWMYCLAKVIPRKRNRAKRPPYIEPFSNHWVHEYELEKESLPKQIKLVDLPSKPPYWSSSRRRSAPLPPYLDPAQQELHIE